MPLLRFFALQVAIGFGIAAVFMVALLLANPGGLGTLLLAPATGLLPPVMLWLLTGLTFGGVQFAAALALAAGSPPSDDGGALSASPPHALARVARRPRVPSR